MRTVKTGTRFTIPICHKIILSYRKIDTIVTYDVVKFLLGIFVSRRPYDIASESYPRKVLRSTYKTFV